MAFFVFLLVLVLVLIPAAVAGRFPYTCPAEFQCGNFGILKFPFTDFTKPDCGLSMLDCSYQPLPSITLSRSTGQWFVTKKKLQKNQNIISVTDLFLHRLLLAAKNNTKSTSTCDLLKFIVFLPNTLSISYTIKYNMTIFRCRKYPPYIQEVTEYFKNNRYRKFESCEEFDVLYRNPKYYGYPKGNDVPDQPVCSSITIPMLPWDHPDVVSNHTELLQMLSADFDLEWRVSDRCYRDCHLKGGRCETNEMNEFSCVPFAAATERRFQRRSGKSRIVSISNNSSNFSYLLLCS